MDTQRWELAGNIFERLLGTPQDERKLLLDSLCGEDLELKHVVASMLDSESSALHFEQGLGAKRAGVDTTTDADAPPPATPIGPWRLVRKIGSGGMGVVWLAERADGQFEQRAALKLIKRGMDSEAVLKRFLRERQILARLTHPNIAHLLDGGIATDGSPYFAMEYVEGLPLLRYCHEHSAKLELRLKLFLDVCGAVQFAHTHHVVHRDLKPSNVLVTANASVKLLDFGIAKLLQSDDSDVETITHLQRERPMTPAYAAPEQIRGDKISEATDVYALGCVLYELLTGQRVRDFSGAADVKDVLRIVEATDPVAPSRLKLASTPVPLKRLRGDLDTIVLTALKRDPARRYASVDAFAADLQNYLAGEPISARRDHVLYRAYKYTRRHRIGVAMTLAIAIVVILASAIELRERTPPLPVAPGSAMAIVDFNNLSQDKQNAWLAPALAEMLATELTIGTKMHVLPDELVGPARADLAAPMAGGYAQQSLTTLRKRLGADYVLSGSYLVSGSAGEARLRLDLALQDTRNGAAIASVAQSGALADLSSLVEKAGASLREKSGLAAATGEIHTDKAQPPNTEVARRMGNALAALHQGDPVHARDELLEAVALAPGYAPAYMYLAQAWKALGYDAKAVANAQQAAANAAGLSPKQRLQIEHEVSAQKADWSKAIELDRKLLALDPGDIETQFGLIDDLVDSGQPAESEAALASLRKLPGIQGDPRIELKAAHIADARGDRVAQAQHAELALRQAQVRDEQAILPRAKQSLAAARNALGKRDEAQTLAQEAIDDYRRNGNPRGEADMHVMLAIIEGEKNQPDGEREQYQRALEIYQRSGNRAGVALIYRNLLGVLWNQGDRDGAQTAGNNALNILRETGDLKGQVWTLAMLATIQLDDAVTDAGLDNLRQAIHLSEQIGDRAQLVDALDRYAEALRLRGSLDDAQAACVRAQTESRQTGNPASELVTENICAYVSRDRGDVAAAIAAFNQSRTMSDKLQETAYAASTNVALAQIDMERDQWESAIDRLNNANAIFAAAESVGDEAAAQALLALCLQRQGRASERDNAIARAKDLRSRITRRYDSLVVDVALARVAGESGDRDRAIDTLKILADSMEKSQWLGDALEARLSVSRLLESKGDAGADAWRAQLLATAHEHGFGWIQQRLQTPRR